MKCKFAYLICTALIVVACEKEEVVQPESETSLAEPALNTALELDETSWDSLAKHTVDPEWFADSKLGIYFHWGPYSASGYPSEWYPRWMHMEGREEFLYHTQNFGHPSEFGYHDFIPMLTAEYFDAKEWVALFKSAGARFAGPVAQHHDGFAMWDSKVNPWNSKKMGPKRDILGELFSEIEASNLKTIATFHHARTYQKFADDEENWGDISSYFPFVPGLATSDRSSDLKYLYGNLPEDEFRAFWLNIVTEVVDNYEPDIIWFDSGLDSMPEEDRKKMVAAQLRSGIDHRKETVVAYKQEDLPRNAGVLDIEQGGMSDISEDYWLTDMTLSHKSWSYYPGQTYKPVDLLIRNMIDIWSKRGIVLLNVSPTEKGVISDEQRTILADLGAWINKHEEAVYQVRPYKRFGYGNAKLEEGKHGGIKATTSYTAEDIRFSVSKDQQDIFVYILGVPEAGQDLRIDHIVGDVDISEVSLLGSDVKLTWRVEGQQLVIGAPEHDQLSDIASVFKVRLAQAL